MSRLRLLSPALAAAGVLTGAALAPAAQAAPTTIATVQRAVAVAAWAGTVAWSEFDPATNVYHVVVSRNGAAPQRVAVAPNAVAFDLDLGTNRTGSTYAVYSRCTTPATENTPPTGCDLYRLSLASGVETKLESLSSPDWDEREPTIFRGEIGFIRTETHGGRTQDVLRTGNTTSGARGTTARVKLNRLAGALTDPELSFSRVAYIRTNRNGSQRDVHVRSLRANGSDRRVYRARSGGANFANIAGLSVSDTGASFMWARTNQGSGTGNRLIRYSIHTGRLAYAQGSSRWTSTAWASQALGAAVMVDESGTGTCFANVNEAHRVSATTSNVPDRPWTGDAPQATRCSVQLTGHASFTAGP